MSVPKINYTPQSKGRVHVELILKALIGFWKLFEKMVPKGDSVNFVDPKHPQDFMKENNLASFFYRMVYDYGRVSQLIPFYEKLLINLKTKGKTDKEIAQTLTQPGPVDGMNVNASGAILQSFTRVSMMLNEMSKIKPKSPSSYDNMKNELLKMLQPKKSFYEQQFNAILDMIFPQQPHDSNHKLPPIPPKTFYLTKLAASSKKVLSAVNDGISGTVQRIVNDLGIILEQKDSLRDTTRGAMKHIFASMDKMKNKRRNQIVFDFMVFREKLSDMLIDLKQMFKLNSGTDKVFKSFQEQYGMASSEKHAESQLSAGWNEYSNMVKIIAAFLNRLKSDTPNLIPKYRDDEKALKEKIEQLLSEYDRSVNSNCEKLFKDWAKLNSPENLGAKSFRSNSVSSKVKSMSNRLSRIFREKSTKAK